MTWMHGSRSSVAFEGVTPILRVSNLDQSVEYYVNALGFALLWRHDAGIAAVRRGKCELFLCEGDQGHPGSWVWLGVEDVDAVFAEYQATGAIIRNPPTNYTWAREMQVADPDGNVLRMGSDANPDEPAGDWLDMHGRRWRRGADGQMALVDEK